MKKYRVEGMMCNHCRMHVEKALNALEGVSASVTLDPPAAEVRFTGPRTPTRSCSGPSPKPGTTG